MYIYKEIWYENYENIYTYNTFKGLSVLIHWFFKYFKSLSSPNVYMDPIPVLVAILNYFASCTLYQDVSIKGSVYMQCLQYVYYSVLF